jgi:hypothetical protein
MASPRERDHRSAPTRFRVPSAARRHHFHDTAPWPHRRYGDYHLVDGYGWWPRWFPYWDPSWYAFWWSLYDYYGGDTYPDYAEYARDALLRQSGPEWGLTIGGAPMIGQAIVRDHRTLPPAGGGPIVRDHRTPQFGMPSAAHHPVVSPDVRFRIPSAAQHPTRPDHQRYPHPHDHYRDYFIVNGMWWPHWFPYWDAAWRYYWDQLYAYYGGDDYPDYAQYARDAHLRAEARARGWL